MSRSKHSFDPSSTLLASDVKIQDDSVAYWIRSPKVKRQDTGDVVEVWGIPMRRDLDPLGTLKAFVKRRLDKFGPAESSPMFIHEDGSIYTKFELNSDLALLLSMFPELENPRDKFSGHSFRAGLATILSVQGFSPEEIQQWGRWRSNAFLVYIKDQARRREVSKRLQCTFRHILAFV